MSRFLLPVPNATDELSVPFSERISIAWPHSELNGQKLLWLAFSLLLLFVWVLFLVLYLSRVLGPIVGRILTRMAHHFGYEGEIMMESFSLSLIGGRVLFRNATYICDDFSVHCEYGCIVFGYWIPLSDADIALESSEKSRLHLWLSGFDVHLYNSSMFRRGMTGGLGERVSSPKLNCSQDTVNKVKSQDAFYKMLWSLIGCVQLELFSTKIIVGNHLLPTVLAIHVERSQSQFSRRHSEVDGRQRVIHQTNAKNVEISFLKCEDFCESKSYRLSARTGPPPRTMGQGFSLLHSSTLKVQSQLTVLEAVQIEDMSSPRPCCNIVMDLGSDVEIAYGPWADAQRLILMEFFYPVDYHIAELTKLPGAGESQILERVDLVVTAKENMHVDLWFTRDDELNVILTTIKRRATIEVSLPLTVDESGSEISLKCSLEGAVCSTSLAFRKLFQSDVINADIVAHIPRAYNGLQSWQLSLHLGHISAWFIWDHTTFFMDLMKEISLETLSDIFTFAPAIWKFTVECSDFEIIFILNDKNWIDASRPSGNLLASVVGSMMTAKFDIVKDDFCMPKSRFFADIKGRNSLAARFRLPDKSTMSPALQSLFKDAFFASYAPCVDLPANTELPVGWIDFWRTESASITVEFIYHPLYLDPCTDLPESAIPTKFTTKASHPLELDEDTLQITVSIGGSEFFASGYALWFAKNFVENYFGMYNKVSDIDSFKAHTRLSRRMFGDVHEPVEFYRPLRLKMCVRVQNVRAHCLIHSVQTDGPVSDSCPVIYMEQFVVEVVRSLRETKIQVCLFGCAMFFERSRSFPTASEGFLTADTISFRGHAFLSEEGISWDAGSIEYAWIIELTVGNVVGKLHPTQVVMLLQFVETVHLMTNATDEELLVSEKYDLCQHMNDIRTCPRSNLGLTDAAFRTQNCESADNLEYKFVRAGIDNLSLYLIEDKYAIELSMTPARVSVCNCHESSFCSSILLGILNINVRLFTKAPSETAPSSGNWLECAKFYFEDIELVVQLPYAKEEGHLPRERKRFLRKHDRLTKRLYFLWTDEKKCGCYGCMAFFGEEDLSGCVFMSDFTQRLAVPKTDNEFPTQPGYMQSIIYHCKSALVNTPADFYKSMDVIVDIGTSDSRAFSQDRSTSVGPNVDYSDFMRRSILCCAPLMRSYSSFLAVFTFDIPRVEVPVFGAHGAINEWATNVAPIITKRRDGINELELRQLKRPLQDEAKKKRMPSSSSSAGMLPFRESAHPDWGADPSVLYVKGYVCTLAKLFITPLGVEVVEKLGSQAAVALTALHPSFIVQRIYAGCAASRHLQPLTATVPMGIKKSNIENVCARVGLPSIDLVIFQSALIETPTNVYDSDMFPLSSGAVTALLRESSLAVYAKQSGDDNLHRSLSFECTLSGHAQMSAMIDTRNSDCFSVKPTKYISNWASLNVAKRLRNYELRPIIDGDLPHLALSGIIECDRITSSQQLRRINVDIVEPWLYVGFGKTNNDTFKKQVYLFCQLTSSMLSAWIYCWYRIYITVRNSLADYEEWIDLAFAKVLADAARYKDELIVSMGRSAMNDVKRYAKATNCCASCKLMLLLLKYQARAVRNSDERNYWTQIRQAANNAGLTLKPIRKLAIVATLNEWQQFIAPHVKLADVLTARKYIGSHPEQGDLPADSNVKDSTRITLDKSPRVAPRGSSSTINVRPNDLILPVFFWSIFEKLKLHANNLNGTFLAEMSASFTLTIDNLKVSIVERNELDVPTRHSSSCTTRPLFTLESFRSDGHISHHFIMDEHRLRPIKACLEIYYNCEVPRLSADVSPSAWRFLDELRIVHKYCTQISTVFKKPIVSMNIDFTPPRTPSITEAKVTGTVSGAACNPIWTRSLHNAIRTYKLSKPDAATHTSKAGTLRLSVEGTVNLTAVYCFSTLDNVNVLLELSGAKVRHKSVHDDSPTERQSSDVLYTVLNAIHIELTTGVKIGVGTIAESIYKKLQCSFRREYDGKAFKKVVDLKLDDAFLSTTVDTHRIAAIFAKCLIKWVKEAGSDWNDVLRATYSEDVKSEQAQLQVCFALKVLRVQISAKISSTILLQYDMEDIRIAAELPKKFEVLLSKHSLSFTMSPVKNVQEQNRPSKCALTLPPVCVRHEIRNTDEEECLIIGGENLRYKDGLHSNIIVSIGNCEDSISLDFINLLILAKECIVAEWPVVQRALIVHPVTPKEDEWNAAIPSDLSKKLYSLQISFSEPSLCADEENAEQAKMSVSRKRKSQLAVGSGSIHWVNLTVASTDSAAVRITIESLSLFATNRWICHEDAKNRLFCSAHVNLSAKIGQLAKMEMFQEVDLRELAVFMAQMSLSIRGSSVNSLPNTSVKFIRSLVMMKSAAPLKVKSFLHEQKLARKYWLAHRHEHFGAEAFQLQPAPSYSESAAPNMEESHKMMSLTVTVTEGATFYMPLYSRDLQPHTSAVLISLRAAEMTANIRRDSSLYAKFNHLKTTFIENFDEASNDVWTRSKEGTGNCSFIVFPRGTCKIATKSRTYCGAPKRTTSIQCSLKGMTADLSSRLGCMVGSINNTITSVEEHALDVWDRERMMLSGISKERDDEIDPDNVLSTIVHPGAKLNWLEQKMYDQTRKIDELTKMGTRGGCLEKEKKRLKKYALVRAQHFKHSMLDRLKRRKIKRTGAAELLPYQNESVSKGIAEVFMGLNGMQNVTAEVTNQVEESSTASMTGESSEDTNSTQPSTTPTGSESSISKPSSEVLSFDEISLPITPSAEDERFIATSKSDNVDVQVHIESGECILRSTCSSKYSISLERLRQSLDGKQTRVGQYSECTKLTVPGIKVNSYFSSENKAETSVGQVRQPSSLYVAIELSGMPEETSLTPALSDYVQQLVDSIPQDLLEQKSEVIEDNNDNSTKSATGSLIANFGARISFDLLIALTVQSCAIRLEGRQQTAAAMDLLLRLPSLKLVGCRRRSDDADSMYMSTTLKGFSLRFYNLNQPSPVDALSLMLDNFSFSISRVSRTSSGSSISTHFASSIIVDLANFTYDMRRLSELIAFPRPWYRRSTPRLFFTGPSSSSQSKQPQTARTVSATQSSATDDIWTIRWNASVEWKALNARIQMSTTMGDTKWDCQDICLNTICLLNSREERDFNIRLKIPSSVLTAQGGAAAGCISLSGVHMEFCQNAFFKKPTITSAKCVCNKLDARIEWMGRAILIAHLKEVSFSLFDDWNTEFTPDGTVSKAEVVVNGNVRWNELKVVVTKVTFINATDIVTKLRSFFQEQIRNSRTMWGSARSSTLSRRKVRRARQSRKINKCTWVNVLDLLTEHQSTALSFPMPSGENGLTVVGARFVVDAGLSSVSFMNGDVNAQSWALAQVGSLSALFVDEAYYAFLDEMNTLGVTISQRLVVSLSSQGDGENSTNEHFINAICKVERKKNSVLPKVNGVEECLRHCIDRPLEQLKMNGASLKHSVPVCYSVLELFEVPALDVAMTSLQNIPINPVQARARPQKVRTTFACEFHGSVGVQTDFNTQVSFLPELMKSYALPTKELQKVLVNVNVPKTASNIERLDNREFICERWIVQPKIRFIDNVKWDPPVIDEILKKLQIFDHRATIPKVLQRGLLDSCDQCASHILLALIEAAKRSSSNMATAHLS